MSATEAKIATNKQQQPPKLTVIFCVLSIPLISAFLESVDKVLTNNAYTRQLYKKAKVFSSEAFNLTEPLWQATQRLEPLIICADSVANKAVDAVEWYTFKVKTLAEVTCADQVSSVILIQFKFHMIIRHSPRLFLKFIHAPISLRLLL